MIKDVRITNFKVISDSGALALQPLTILIGRNGSGKSSLVEALDWLGLAAYNGAEAATEPFHRVQDIIGKWGDTSPTIEEENNTLFDGHIVSAQSGQFSISLTYDPQSVSAGEEVSYLVRVTENKEGLPRVSGEELITKTLQGSIDTIRTDGSVRLVRIKPKSPKPKQNEFSQFSNDDKLALDLVEQVIDQGAYSFRDFLQRSVFLRLSPRAIARFAPARVRPSPRLLDEEGARLAALLGQLDPEAIEILIEKLSFIIPNAQGITAHQPSIPSDRRYFRMIETYLGDEITIPSWVLSEGTRRITAIIAILLHNSPPPLLCIEEVENGLDPWTLKFLLAELTRAAENNTQVILTSHSPYLLDMVAQEQIILCNRQPFGVEFYTGDRLPEDEQLRYRMGLGALYTNRFLYPQDDGV